MRVFSIKIYIKEPTIQERKLNKNEITNLRFESLADVREVAVRSYAEKYAPKFKLSKLQKEIIWFLFVSKKWCSAREIVEEVLIDLLRLQPPEKIDAEFLKKYDKRFSEARTYFYTLTKPLLGKLIIKRRYGREYNYRIHEF